MAATDAAGAPSSLNADAWIKKQLAPHLQKTLQPHQWESLRKVATMYLQKGRVRQMLALDMGLGKTLLSTCIWYCLRREATPFLVVCPANVCGNFANELKKWFRFEAKQIAILTTARIKTAATAHLKPPGKKRPRPGAAATPAAKKRATESGFVSVPGIPDAPTLTAAQRIKALKPEQVADLGLREFKKRRCLAYITSYEKARGIAGPLQRMGFNLVILDESHRLKTWNGLTTKKLSPLCIQAKHLLLLSGTPLDRPRDLYAQLHVMAPRVFPSFHRYATRYCDPKKKFIGRGQFVMEYKGRSNTDELTQRIKPYLCRYLKVDLEGFRLPPRRREQVVVPPSEEHVDMIRETWDEYRTLTDELNKRHRSFVGKKRTKPASFSFGPQSKTKKAKVEEVDDEELDIDPKKLMANAQFSKIVQKTARWKLKPALAFLRDYLDTIPLDEKVLVFAHHQFVLNAVQQCVDHWWENTRKRLEKDLSRAWDMSRDVVSHILDFLPQYDGVIRIDGGVKPMERYPLVEEFQTDPTCKLAVLSIKAAGIGINLTAARRVIFMEMVFNASDMDQAECRVWRMGQTREVLITYILLQGSIDRHSWQIIKNKSQTIAKTLDGKEHSFRAKRRRVEDL